MSQSSAVPLRDFFAALAIQGCVGSMWSDNLLAKCGGNTDKVADLIALAGYQIADAMLQRRVRDEVPAQSIRLAELDEETQ